MRTISPLLALAVLLAAGPAPTAAQETAAEVSGFVRDTTGGVLPGVTVTVRVPAIGFDRSTITDDKGFYVIPALPVGEAEISAELDGFQREDVSGLALAVKARLRLDLTLRVGRVDEIVNVTVEVPVLSTRADVSHVITGAQTRELAVDGRTYMQLLTLLPGVSTNGSSYEFGTSFRADGQQINGLRKNFAALTVDGAENLDAGSNATQVNNLSIDAIAEFRVATSEYSAENGRAGGAQVSVITQRGTRDFKGGGYYFTRNDRFDAVPFGLTSKDHLDLKDFGWNLGGPVAWSGFNADRSRLFFFAGQEWKRLENQVGLSRINQAVPSLLERQGDFSQSPRLPTDPLTGQPFAGGILPATRLSPNGLRLVNAFPLPDPGQRASATIRPTQTRDIREDIYKIDVPTRGGTNVSVRYIHDTVAQIEPYGSFGSTSNFAQVPTSHKRLSDNVVVNWNQVVGLRNQHELTISGVRNDQDLEQTGTAYLRDGFTAPEIFGGNRNNRMPNVLTVDGYSPGGAGLFGNDYPTHIIGNYYLVKDNLTLVRGSHTFKTGLYFNRSYKAEELRTPDAGAFTFTNGRPAGTGIALANALLGLYSTYSEADRAPYGTMHFNQVELYGQDHWQLRRNMTLDYGLRWQWIPGPVERDDQIATFDPAKYDASKAPQINPANGNLVPGTGVIVNGGPVTGIVRAGVDGTPHSLYETRWNNFAPRVGVTWDPWSSAQTVLRGGFGVYYDRPVFNSTRDQGASPPLVRTVQLSNGDVDNPGGGSASLAPPSGFEALATTFKTPTVYSYSAGVQRQLPWKFVADVNYVGNQARHLLRTRELNFVTPESIRQAGANVNYNRQYPGYGRIIINETTGQSDYDSLQVALNRRIDGAGLSVGAAYTLARARGDSDSEDSTSASSLPQDPLHPAAEYGYLDFSRLHVLAVNYIYYLPWFQNRSDLWGYVLGGWQLSGVTRWNTGRRFSVTAGTTTIRGDQSLLRADLVAGQDPNAEPPGGRSETRWFNTAAFTAPAAAFGNAPRNVLVGPSYTNSDLAVFKNILIAGRWKAQARLEAFNVFNIQNFRTIETNLQSTNFGKVTAYETQRILQLGLRVSF